MPLTKRAKYLLYLCLHITVMFILILLFDSYNPGARSKGDGVYYISMLLATPFAIVAYLLINKLLDLYKAWQYRSGRDVYREEAYEDDAGFIHLNQKMAQVNKHDWELVEILKDSTTFVQSGWDGEEGNTRDRQEDALIELHLDPPNNQSKTAT